MGKRIVADTSTGCLDYYNHGYDIRIIRLDVYLEEKKYIDGDTLTADAFYDYINQHDDVLPKTSQPSLGELMNFFEELIKEGYTEVIVTTISSKLSGVYNGLMNVSEMLKDQIKIIIFDTKTVCFIEGLFAIKAAELLKKEIDTNEILNVLNQMREKCSIFFAVDNLKYLVKNGRLSGASGFLGTMLKIKPLLQVQPDGQIVAIEKIRTTRNALERVVEMFCEYVKDKNFIPYILYTGNPELMNYLIELLKEMANIKDIIKVPCSPVVGTHIGPDAIGIGVFIE